uniref:NAB co-repressor domain-containing protein n=1 Tax=Clastoptera arizonana TaxID=38151 RepID=A0A1B6DSF2_9HEMI
MEYPTTEVTPGSSASSSTSSATGPTPARTSPSPNNTATSATTTNPKILSRNSNGTLVLTSAPNNEAELQLYRVMQRASLLAYYDTLLEMGGDDVQQLCEAGEEEFLEIMALVGMASKPLHVRRLQKALQEWLSNPAMFQTPLVAGGFYPRMATTPVTSSGSVSPNRNYTSPGPLCLKDSHPGRCTISPIPSHSQSLPGETVQVTSGSPGQGAGASTSPGPSPGSPLQLTPVLIPSQITRLADAAHHLVRSLPHLEPKANTAKKKACKDLEHVLTMAEDDPRRMDQIRKYAAIYGRFDCKRKPEKPLTLHEVSVNEAAAQICRLVPALLTRRDELFPLARQVVRDSGYHYSKGHSKSYSTNHMRGMSGFNNGEQPMNCKRPRLDGSPLDVNEEAGLRLRRQERLEQIADELRSVNERTEDLLGSSVQTFKEQNDIPGLQFQMEALQGRQTQLLLEQSELLKQNQVQPSRYFRRSNSGPTSSTCFESERQDTDDTDSQLSFSNASSPSQEVGDSRDSLTRESEIDRKSPSKLISLKQETVQDESVDDLRVVKEILSLPNKNDSSDHFEDPFFQENNVQVILCN